MMEEFTDAAILDGICKALAPYLEIFVGEFIDKKLEPLHRVLNVLISENELLSKQFSDIKEENTGIRKQLKEQSEQIYDVDS